MKNDNTAQIKSYEFALRIVKLSQHRSSQKREFVLSKQLLLASPPPRRRRSHSHPRLHL